MGGCGCLRSRGISILCVDNTLYNNKGIWEARRPCLGRLVGLCSGGHIIAVIFYKVRSSDIRFSRVLFSRGLAISSCMFCSLVLRLWAFARATSDGRGQVSLQERPYLLFYPIHPRRATFLFRHSRQRHYRRGGGRPIGLCPRISRRSRLSRSGRSGLLLPFFAQNPPHPRLQDQYARPHRRQVRRLLSRARGTIALTNAISS